MEPVTTYTSSDGTVTPIVELNNFHLVNAFAKVVVANDAKELVRALREEILKRMDNRPVPAQA